MIINRPSRLISVTARVGRIQRRLKAHVAFVCACVRPRGAAEAALTLLEINGFHMLRRRLLIHQLHTTLSQKAGLDTRFVPEKYLHTHTGCLCHLLQARNAKYALFA